MNGSAHDRGHGMLGDDPEAGYAEPVRWKAARPRFGPLRLVLALVVSAVAVVVTGLILPGVHVKTFLGALEAAALIAVLNAVLPPLVAALRLPLMLVIGFLAVLVVDALILLLVSQLAPNDFKVDSFGWALLAALVMSAVVMALHAMCVDESLLGRGLVRCARAGALVEARRAAVVEPVGSATGHKRGDLRDLASAGRFPIAVTTIDNPCSIGRKRETIKKCVNVLQAIFGTVVRRGVIRLCEPTTNRQDRATTAQFAT